MELIRWGIIGCGKIADKFASDLKLTQNGILVAVASKDIIRAKKFGEKYNVSKAYGNYEELVKNPEVDAIYIATTHNFHHPNTLLCLEHQKAVLCEKPLAINAKQVKEMVDLARRKKVFFMEALWTKFLPHFQIVSSMVQEGKLGKMQSMQVNFGFKPYDPIPDRLFNPELGGGSLLDIGIYNVFMALSLMGKPDGIHASMSPAPTGVDEQCAVTFTYKNGGFAQLLSSLSSNLATSCDIAGTMGRIHLSNRFYEPSTIINYYPSSFNSGTIIPCTKPKGWGYHEQISHVNLCISKGLTESPIMTHDDSLLLMTTLDEIRIKAGIKYMSYEL
jgi:predicted dehydrogenase